MAQTRRHLNLDLYSGDLHLGRRIGAALASPLPFPLQPAGYLGVAVLATA